MGTQGMPIPENPGGGFCWLGLQALGPDLPRPQQGLFGAWSDSWSQPWSCLLVGNQLGIREEEYKSSASFPSKLDWHGCGATVGFHTVPAESKISQTATIMGLEEEIPPHGFSTGMNMLDGKLPVGQKERRPEGAELGMRCWVITSSLADLEKE